MSGDADSEALRDGTGQLRQFVAGASLVHVSLLDSVLPGRGYLLSGYHRDRTAAKGVDGLYPIPPGAAVFTFEFRNSDASAASFDSFTVTRSFGTHVETDVFQYTGAGEQWSRSHSSGRRVEELGVERDPATGSRTETRIVMGASGGLISRERSIYQRFAFGERIVSHTVDPTIEDAGGQIVHQGRNLLTEYGYDDGSANPYRRGELISVKRPNGSWLRHEYDNSRRPIKSATGQGDVLDTAPDDQCRVTD